MARFKKTSIRYKDNVIGYMTGVNIEKDSLVVTIKLTNCYKCGSKLKDAGGIGQFCPNKKCDVLDGVGLFCLKEIK